ncbi:MAG: threonine synthase, partial [Oscillospiraceae bacterium]
MFLTMLYNSTRNKNIKVNSAKAISSGLSCEGGLFVPETLPSISTKDIETLVDKTYNQRAVTILKDFLTDFSLEQLENCVNKAYTSQKFESDFISPISLLLDGTYILELWHGPTCAFKDMALQLLPHLLMTSAQIEKIDKEIVILVATSGDTGKAALEGFKNAPNTQIIVFYPQDGVSTMQKRQMTTQEGDNVYVCAINGNFDDAQTGVKKIFTDEQVINKLENAGKMFSSANSINWGRLVPQIVYYISSYCELVKDKEIELGEKVNVVVPTGNFGNILAAYYAKKMGVPFDKLICASNENNVLTDFINTGVYDKNRDFKPTISPSMDILIS